MHQRHLAKILKVISVSYTHLIGNNAKEYWESLVKGESGAAPITLFDASNFKTKFACEVKSFDPLNHFDKKEAKKMDRNTQFGLVAAREAVEHSRILQDEVDKNRVGVIWGSGIGGLETFETEVLAWSNTDIPRFNPFFIPKMIADITPVSYTHLDVYKRQTLLLLMELSSHSK